MMQFLRSSMKPIFFIVILAFIVGFLFLDVGRGSFGCSPRMPNAAAVVNGEPIPWEMYQQQANLALGQFSPDAPGSERMRLQVENRAFHQLVEDRLLWQQAVKRGLGASTREVHEVLQHEPPPEIMQAPGFQTNGKFDPSKYYQALSNPQFFQLMFETVMGQLPVDKFRAEIMAGARASNPEVLELQSNRFQQATVSFIRVSPGMFAPDPASLSESDVRAYFESHADEYTPKRSARLSVAVANRHPGSADTLEAAEVVESIHQELQSGQPFQDIMEVHSENPSMRGGPGDRFYRKTDPDISLEMAERLETLSMGQFTEPYLDRNGYHITMLDSVKIENGEKYYRLKDINQRVQISPTTENELERTVYEFWQKVRGGEKFQTAAGAGPIMVEDSGQIDLDSERLFVPNLPSFVELRQFLEGAKPGEVSNIFRGPGGWFLWRLEEKGPGKAPSLEAVEPRVRADLVKSLGLDQAKARAQDVATRAKSGASLESIADADPILTLDTSRPFPRYSAISGLGKDARVMGAAFAIRVGSVEGPIETESGDLVVIRVDARDPAPATGGGGDPNVSEQLRQNLVSVKRNDLLASYLSEARKKADIEDLRPVKTGTIE